MRHKSRLLRRPAFFVLLAGFLLFPGPCIRGGDNLHFEFSTVSPAVIEQRLKLVKLKMADRQATMETLFQEVGCTGDRLKEQPVPHSKQPSLICTLPGETSGEIVVGGHYDLAERGMGAVDDWSGVVLLPSLYQGLKTKARRHTFVLIAFAAEEQGMVGSTAYVKHLSKEERAVKRAMVNLECLGLNPPGVWGTRADPRLLEAYAKVATALGLMVRAVNVDRVGDDDSHPFLSAGIPVLTIHSITQETWPILHSTRDNVSAIHQDYCYAAYRLAAAYLTYLDQSLD